MVRAVKFYKSALSRQLGEAVRIRRRGGQGSILNSKSEFDLCRIPRLVLKENEEEQVKHEEEEEQRELNNIMEKSQGGGSKREDQKQCRESREQSSWSVQLVRPVGLSSRPIYKLHLTHSILHNAPCTLHLTHCILHIASYTLHLAHCILHITSYTLHLPY